MSNWARISPSAAAGLMKPVTLHNAIASPLALPVAAGGGGDISGARDGDGMGPVDWDIQITGSVAATITGPVGLYGEKDDGVVCFLGKLNNGEDIKIQSATVGFAQQVSGLGLFKRALIGGIAAALAWSAGNLTVKATPMLVATKVP